MMKRILWCLIAIVVLASMVEAQPHRNDGPISKPGTQIREEDGTPAGWPIQLKFPNTSLTDNADGTYSVDFVGGSLPTTYLKLDCSNDPLTASLDIYGNVSAYDAAHTSYIRIAHDGTSANVSSNGGDISLLAPGTSDINLRLGDALGVNKVSFQDSGNNEQASVDSDGNFDTVGRVSVFSGASYGQFYHDGADVMIAGNAGDITLMTASDVNALLSDAAGASLFRVQDSGVNTVASINSDGSLDLTTGNITTVPIGADIQAYINAATAGDTLVLAAGTYTITDDIEVIKSVNIVGQGFGITTITTAISGVWMFDVRASNVRISNMSIINTDGIVSAIRTTSNHDNLVFENLDITMSGTGGKFGIYVWGSNAIIRNVIGNISSSNSNALGVYIFNTNTTTQNAVVDCFDLNFIADGTGGNSLGIKIDNVNDANTIHANIYNSIFVANDGANDYGLELDSTTTSNASVNSYNCTFNGADYDVANNGVAGCTLTLYDTTLVNNTTSGTITYGGTVHSKGLTLNSGVELINTNSTTALLVEQDGVKDNTLVVDTTNGRVGVGSAPVYTFDVLSADSIKSRIMKSATDSATASTSYQTAEYLHLGGQEYNVNSYNLIGFGYRAPANTYSAAYFGFQETAEGTVTKGDFVWLSRNSTNDVGNDERMRLTSAGFLGIGCTPTATLSVNGGFAYNSATPNFYVDDDSARTMGIWGSHISRTDGDSDGLSLGLNYLGYAGGTTRFRDTIIYNGKSTQIAMFDGSSGYMMIGDGTPATALDIDSNSNTQCLRLRGAEEENEIADMYMTANGALTISTKEGDDSGQQINLMSKDDEYGIVIWESDGTGTDAFSNLYVVDGTPDYININVGAASSTLGLTIDANQNVGVGCQPSAPSTAVTTNLICQPYINNAKFDMIEDINNLVGTSNIKGFWVFDQTGATTSVTDRSPNAHTLTLGGNASTLSPAVAGLCPNLTTGATAATSWYVTDHNDFTPPAGGFTVILLQKSADFCAAKRSTASNAEWQLFQIGAGIYWQLLDPTEANYTSRAATAPSSTEWHILTGTASTNTQAATMNVYVDGVLDGGATTTSGTFTVTNGTSNIDTFSGKGSFSVGQYGVMIIINKELTAAEVKRISDRLQSYAGVFL